MEVEVTAGEVVAMEVEATAGEAMEVVATEVEVVATALEHCTNKIWFFYLL